MFKVTYLTHSGVKAEIGDVVLIFDYYTQNGKFDILGKNDVEGKEVYIFASHGHDDHFDEAIFKLKKYNKNIRYVFSDDIKTSSSDDVIFVAPNKEYDVGSISVKTLKSTDEGVAFIVKANGKTFFHFGDLNHWHWNGESDAYNEDMAKAYKKEIDGVKGEKIDVAFIPVDLRLEDKFTLGLNYAEKNLDIKHIMPIHFWRKFEVYDKIKKDPLSGEYFDKITKLEKENQSFEFDD